MKSRRDPRWVLAMVSLVFAFGIQGLLIWRGEGDQMPAWIVAVVTAAMSYYFGARNGKFPHPSEFTPDQVTAALTAQSKPLTNAAESIKAEGR